VPDSYILSRHPRTQSKDGEDICRRCSMYRLETVLWPCPAAKEVEDMAAEIERLRARLGESGLDSWTLVPSREDGAFSPTWYVTVRITRLEISPRNLARKLAPRVGAG
jgi:hypothetical protein